MQDIVVIGAGGHAKVVVDAIAAGQEFRTVAVCALADEVGGEVLGVPIVGTNEDLPRLRAEGTTFAAIGIGSVGNTDARAAAVTAARAAGLNMPAIVHPRAIVSTHAELGEGVFVAAGAVIGPGARVGAFALVNTGVIVDHDCEIGEFVHLSPGVALSGGVRIGDGTHVGTGVATIQYLSIGSDVLIGAGAVVVEDIPDGVLVIGNPARIVRNRT